VLKTRSIFSPPAGFLLVPVAPLAVFAMILLVPFPRSAVLGLALRGACVVPAALYSWSR
jgi:hypothetical protein